MSAVAELHNRAVSEAENLARCIYAITETLSDLMQKAHGGNWRIQVDPEGEFVIVSRRQEQEISKPPRSHAA